MLIPQILPFPFLSTIFCIVKCGYILNPETKDSLFYREDTYIYVEDDPEYTNSRSLNSHSENSTTKEKNEMKKGLNLLTQNDEFYPEDSYIYAEDETEYANSSLSVLTPSLRQGCEPWNCNGRFCEDRCPCIGGIGGKPPRNPRNNSLSEGVEIKRGTQFFVKKFFSLIYQSFILD